MMIHADNKLVLTMYLDQTIVSTKWVSSHMPLSGYFFMTLFAILYLCSDVCSSIVVHVPPNP
jgi:hypothetical protein